MESNKSAHLILLEKSWKFFKNFHLRKMEQWSLNHCSIISYFADS
ncbi:hypothetical protein HMPREF1344_01629 [Enterococcus faecalis R508]|nr:hypothetical protein HMPREF9499_02595 [Enterococcus faecalis TX0012]EJV37431.1 hypothetical protein HMPREF1344_01629 [Enterococcus faecalis R508]EPH63116.1 hypothetical protein D930_02475 [Enterococcus faecalis KI-6-1-110608-1]KAJ64083.1 hypothetical protein P785_0499 [Enterococcus faecalis KS19]